MKQIFILVLIVGSVLGYGYWHSITHGSAYIDFKYKKPEDRENIISKLEVFFLDNDGKVLALGVGDNNNHYIELIHPEVGNCHDIVGKISNSKTRKLWQQYYEKQSIWIMSWINDVHQVQVKHENCSSNRIPITVSKYNSDWFLWWIPHPHIGGMPYSYYRASIDMQKYECFTKLPLD